MDIILLFMLLLFLYVLLLPLFSPLRYAIFADAALVFSDAADAIATPCCCCRLLFFHYSITLLIAFDVFLRFRFSLFADAFIAFELIACCCCCCCHVIIIISPCHCCHADMPHADYFRRQPRHARTSRSTCAADVAVAATACFAYAISIAGRRLPAHSAARDMRR